MYYAATLFKLVGFNNPTAVGITVSATNFIFGILNIALVDRFGRRILLSVTVLGMAICLTLAAIAFHWIPIDKNLVLQSDSVGWPGTLVLVGIICYVAFFTCGVAPIAWIGTELMPLEVRAVGTMLVSSPFVMKPLYILTGSIRIPLHAGAPTSSLHQPFCP